MNLATSTGDVVRPGCTLTAVLGPHTGRRFVFVGVHPDAERIIVRFLHPHPFRNGCAHLHPSVFGLSLIEELTRLRRVLNHSHHVWQKVDEWFWAGVFALPALAVFEHYHLADVLFGG